MKFQCVDEGLFMADRRQYWRWMPCEHRKFRVRKDHLFMREQFEQQGGVVEQVSVVDHYFPSHILSTILAALPASDERMRMKLEALACLAIQLPQSQSVSNTIACIVSAFNVLMDKSVTSTLISGVSFLDWSEEFFECNLFEQQAGVEENDKYSWMKKIPDALKNWRDITYSPIVEKITRLMTCAVSVGLCNLSNISWDFDMISSFHDLVRRNQKGAMSLYSAILDTIIVFLEGGYEFFKTGNVMSFFYSDTAARDFDERYFALLGAHENAMNFDLRENPITLKGEQIVLDDTTYIKHVEETIELADSALKTCKKSWQGSLIARRKEMLAKNLVAYNSKRLESDLRMAPYTVYIFGGTSVGKSTFASLLMDVLLHRIGHDDVHVANLKDMDKFEETVTGSTLGIMMDDVMNALKDDECYNAKRMVSIQNNNMCYPTKAVAEEKAKFPFRVKILIVTSNLSAGTVGERTSNCPLSFVRRGHSHLEMEVRPEFRDRVNGMDWDKVELTYGEDDPLCDAWYFKLSEACAVENGGDSNYLRVPDCLNLQTTPRGKGWHGMKTIMPYLLRQVVKHFKQQEKLIDKARRRAELMQYCTECKCPSVYCLCPCECNEPKCQCVCPPESVCSDESDDDEYSVQDEEEEEEVKKPGYFSTFSKTAFAVGTGLLFIAWNEGFVQQSAVSTEACLQEYEQCWDLLGVTARTLGDYFMPDSYMKAFMAYSRSGEFFRLERYLRYVCLSMFILLNVFLCWIRWHGSNTQWILNLCILWIYIQGLNAWRRNIEVDLANNKQAAVRIFKSIRKSKVAKLTIMLASAYALYSGVRIATSGPSLFQQQAGIDPQNAEEIAERDAQENFYAKPHIQPLYIEDRTSNMAYDHIVNVLKLNQLVVAGYVGDKVSYTNALALGGNIILLPKHFVDEHRDQYATIIAGNRNEQCSEYQVRLSSSNMIEIPGKDLVTMLVEGMRPFKEITHLFPIEGKLENGRATFIHRDKEGNFREEEVRVRHMKDMSVGAPFGDLYKHPGYEYHLKGKTHIGLCCSLLLKLKPRACILGFHILGKPNEGCSRAIPLHSGEINSAYLSHFDNNAKPAILPPTDFPESRYGIKMVESTDVHPNCGVNFLGNKSQITYIGSNSFRSTYNKSRVMKSPISDAIARHCNQPRLHDKPAFHKWKNFYLSLKVSSQPSRPESPKLLDRAVADYLKPLLEKIGMEKIRPLTLDEATNGIDGKRFIDSMNMASSAGFPLKGSKGSMVTELEPDEDHQHKVEPPMEVLGEFKRLEDCLLNNKRYYAVFKAALKDEPTEIGKEKVRVFSACDWAAQLAIRTYFLPVARFISMHPLQSECAVGINSRGKEWAQLMKHVERHGKERVFAGDYSKYDLRMNQQMITRSLGIMITLAEAAGYSEHALKIMRGLATELACPTVSYNGDILIFNGMNPSGHNLTVYVNSIANSLYARCTFFSLYPDLDFREHVAITTYGDDIKGTVSEKTPKFTIKAHIEHGKANDWVFTLPDKSDAVVDYMNWDNADFLKRVDCEPVEGIRVGRLDMVSIYKGLHNVMVSNAISPIEQSEQALQNALYELWAYGKDEYETHYNNLAKVAEETGVKMPEWTFDELTARVQ